MAVHPDPIREEREFAWIGDAVLALVAREYILAQLGRMDAEIFIAMTSNHFLSQFGPPTAVEAALGRLYQSSGLEATRTEILQRFIPAFEVQWKNRQRRR